MKHLLIALFVIISLSGKAQLSNELKAFTKETHFPIQLSGEWHQERKLKKTIFRQIYRDTSYFLNNLYFKTFHSWWKQNKNSAYIDDFDLDGDKDLLYFGVSFPPSENPNVLIYFNNGSGCVEKHLGIFLDTFYKKEIGFFFQTTDWWISDLPAKVRQYQTNPQTPNIVEQLTCQLFTYETPNIRDIQKTDTILRFDQPKPLFLRANPPYRDLVQKGDIYDEDSLGLIPANFAVHAYNSAVLDEKTWYYVVIEPGNGFTLREDFFSSFYGEIKIVRGWICVE